MVERVVLIADKELEARKQMAALCIEAGCQVVATNSAAFVLRDIMKRNIQVVLLGSEFDDLTAVDLIPLLKRCNRDLTIILVSNEEGSLPLTRKIREEGIFYHAMLPENDEDMDEIRLALECAFGAPGKRGAKAYLPADKMR